MEIVATIFTLLCVYWSVNKNILTWLASIVGAVAYMYIFVEQNMWAQSVLQIVFIAQSLYGWVNWSKNTDDNSVLKIESLKSNRTELLNVFYFPLLWVSCFLISFYTSSKYIWVDSMLTTLSITATYYMSKRIIESWYIWIFVNVAYIILFITLSLYLSAVLYLILLILSFRGLKEWQAKSQI